MFEVHYSDGHHHQGVGRFETWTDAKRFLDAVKSCGYAAFVEDLTEGRVKATGRMKPVAARRQWLLDNH